jgi:hypothetical protein
MHLLGGWNASPEAVRKKAAKFQEVLRSVASLLLEAGVEPNDLGAHQIVYQIDPEKNVVTMGIIDTEEYALVSQFGKSEEWYKSNNKKTDDSRDGFNKPCPILLQNGIRFKLRPVPLS